MYYTMNKGDTKMNNRKKKSRHTIYIEDELFDTVKHMARSDQRSVNNQMICLIRGALVERFVPLVPTLQGDVSEQT